VSAVYKQFHQTEKKPFSFTGICCKQQKNPTVCKKEKNEKGSWRDFVLRLVIIVFICVKIFEEMWFLYADPFIARRKSS